MTNLVSDELKTLFESMAQLDLQKRATIADIKRSEWYNGKTYSDDEFKTIMKQVLTKVKKTIKEEEEQEANWERHGVAWTGEKNASPLVSHENFIFVRIPIKTKKLSESALDVQTILEDGKVFVNNFFSKNGYDEGLYYY